MRGRLSPGVRGKLAVVGALTVAVIASLWLTTALGAILMMDPMDGMAGMEGMEGMGGGAPATALPRAGVLFVMWWSMMMAMMLPSAAPAIVIYGTVARKLQPRPHTFLFALGYAAVWSAFAALATGLQAIMGRVAPLDGMMALVSGPAGGALLIAAGLYQLTAFKGACLARCQSPFFYLAHLWRKGARGAFLMGWHHGLYCLGCCWVLMLLLFYGGVMDLRWIVGLALYVAAEKLLPQRYHLQKIAAAALVAWGAAVLVMAALG